MAVQQRRLPDDPRALPLLPMIYVAWGDGELSAGEIAGLRSQVETAPWLDDATRTLLQDWLDPDSPPTTQEMRGLLRRIRGAADQLPRGERRSLASLGVAMARADADADGTVWINAETRRALSRLEDTLGILGSEAIREMLTTGASPVVDEEEDAAATRTVEAPAPPLEPFRPAAMTKLLDGSRAQVRREVRALLQQPMFRYTYEVDKTTYRQRVLEWLGHLAEAGFGARAYPGVTGDAPDLGDFIVAIETLACFDLSLLIKTGVQFGLFGGSIYHLGTERHHRRYLAKVASLELPGCFAMTELAHGSNVRALRTVARFDPAGGDFVLNTPDNAARKEWIGNAAAHARLATVFTQLEVDGEDYGVHALLVPIRNTDGKPLPGIRIGDCGHKLGLNGVDNGWLAFDQVRVPRENLLDRFAQVDADGRYESPIPSESKRFFTMLSTLVGGRIAIGGAAIAIARSGLTIAIRYGARRRQFGPAGAAETPILDYRTHQRRLMPLLARTYALGFAQEDLVARYVKADATEEQRREAEVAAAGLKAIATWHCTRTIQTCRECCGAEGYRSVNRLAALKADSDVFATFEGDNTVLLQLVAKGLLTSYKRQFENMQLFGILRHLAEQAASALVELNPVTVRRTDPLHLRDPEFQLTVLRWREQSLLTSSARRLKRRLDKGIDSFNAFLDCQTHLVALSKASVAHSVHESFCTRVATAKEDGTAAELVDVLERLRDLHALWLIEEDAGWFLENGVIEPAKARAIRKQVDQLCLELRPQAVALVDAFAIPETCLAAPIAIPTAPQPGS